MPPSVVFDFLRDTVDSRITFTRASSKTYINSSGLIALAATDAWPVEYDPVTLRRIGRNIVEARTNLFLNSLIDGTILGTQSVTVAATPYTVSFYGTGTITFSGAFAGSLVGSGAYPTRSAVTFTPSAGSLTCTVTGSVQFAQIEAGSFVTPFVPTAGATATRAADVASITGANFTSFWNATQGTIVVGFVVLNSASNNNISATDGTNNERVDLRLTTTGGVTSTIVVVGGVTQVNDGIAATVAGTSYKFASAYQLNNFGMSRNGSAIVSDTSGTLPTVDRLLFGLATGAGTGLNGWISSLSYYPVRLPDSQLRSLSA